MNTHRNPEAEKRTGWTGGSARDRKLGDVGLGEYLQMLGRAELAPRSKRTWVRVAAAVSVAAVVVLAFAAGKLGPWNGRNTGSLTFEQVLQLLEKPAETSYQHETGVTRFVMFMQRGIEDVRRVAEGPTLGKADVNAILALRLLGTLAIRSVVQFEQRGMHAEYVESCLKAWHEALEGR